MTPSTPVSFFLLNIHCTVQCILHSCKTFVSKDSFHFLLNATWSGGAVECKKLRNDDGSPIRWWWCVSILREESYLFSLSAWGLQVEKEPLIKQGRSYRCDLLVPQVNGPVIVDVAVSHPSATHTQQNVYVEEQSCERNWRNSSTPMMMMCIYPTGRDLFFFVSTPTVLRNAS